jgi:hypothetical protein
MEEVIGSIPIRSTKSFNKLQVLWRNLKGPKGPIREGPLQFVPVSSLSILTIFDCA